MLTHGDFVLIPAAHEFTFSSVEPPAPGHYTEPVVLAGGQVRLGAPGGPLDVLFLVGHCVFGSPDAALLVSLRANDDETSSPREFSLEGAEG